MNKSNNNFTNMTIPIHVANASGVGKTKNICNQNDVITSIIENEKIDKKVILKQTDEKIIIKKDEDFFNKEITLTIGFIVLLYGLVIISDN